MSPHPAAADATRVDVATPEGTAQVRVFGPAPVTGADGDGAAPPARGTLLVGHGAGGRKDAADVLEVTDLTRDGWTVVLVDQPWRVAGRSVATRPPNLDRAWLAVAAELATAAWQRRHGIPLPPPWVVGGRSAGARVACRTSVDPTGPAVAGVVCLAFPLHPPGRPDRSRADELAQPLGAGIPTLVVQGAADPFGSPEEVAVAAGRDEGLTLVGVPGNHSPSRDLAAVRRAVGDFLAALP
ncbi:alpha/beta family hydrolase [Ornithinimicrobium pekingense]|uniref:KANL3/Tex30 alpha/beta hydrolase-like domain-containing protein n=1 Tax=Ornithinimicrobium pekingense TaxID=384677 RepID=A0ABQ2F9B2_9MICO|nr:alpha/beta family hydrolase [Ornithinimicrobium pekingense]GGK65391.1 hypothetical protein GCM10011509_12030 [Ornithinimicrobium pekingense]